jgi:hypothetical protein
MASGSSITRSAGTSSLTVSGASTLANSVSTGGTQTYQGAVTLAAGTTLSGSTINTQSTLAGGGYALTISGAADIDGAYSNVGAMSISGNATIDAAIGATSLSMGGTTALAANVTTSGTQTYTGAVTMSGNRTLSASTVHALSTVNSSSALTVYGDLSAGAELNLSRLTVTGTADLAGDVTTTGSQTYVGMLNVLAGHRTLTGSTIVTDTVDGHGNALTIAGNADIGGQVVNVSEFTVTGEANLSANVSTSGMQTYQGAVTLGSAITLTGSTIHTQSTLAGGGNTLTISGAADIDAAYSNLGALSIGGATALGANVSTSGTQTYTGAVTLTADATLSTSNSDVSFGGAVDGAHQLDIRAGTGKVTFNASVGANAALDGLTTADAPSGAYSSPSGSTVLAANVGSVRTTGNQVYNHLTFNTNTAIAKDSDNVVVSVNTEDNTTTDIYPLRLTSSAGSLNFVGTVEGGEYAKTNKRSLFLNAATSVTFNNQVGFDAITGNSGNILANYTRHYGVYRLDVTAPTVNILANITAYEHINIHGDAYIGGHTGQAETRYVFSLDPAINFFGKVDGYGLVDGTYTLDARAIAFDPAVVGLPEDNPAQPTINFTQDIGSRRLLAGITTQVAVIDMVSLRRGGDSTGWNGGSAPRNQGSVTTPTLANSGTIRFGGNVNTTGDQNHFASRFVLEGGGSRGNEFNGTAFDFTLGSGGITGAGGSRPRMRFSTNPTGDLVRELQRAGVSITSLPSDLASEIVKAQKARQKHSTDAIEEVLDAAAMSTLPSVEVGDLIEEQCDRDDNDNCRIPLPIQISQNP